MSKFLNNSRRSRGYSRVDKEDPDEVKHRKAQFLIYKGMQQADLVVPSRRRRPSWLKVRATKLRIRVGRRIKKLRKSFFSMVSCGNADVGSLHKQFVSQFKAFKNLV